MNWTNLRNASEWVLLVVLVLGGGAIARAQNGTEAADTSTADAQPEGKIVPITPLGGSTFILDADEIVSDAEDVVAEAPKFWLGVFGGPVSDELRAQVTIPEGEGVLVRHVVPESPADKGGLQDFDILLRANSEALTDIRELTDLVATVGDSGEEIKLDVLRAGKEVPLAVKPEVRPERPVGNDRRFAPRGFDAPRGFGTRGDMPRDPDSMLRFFEQQLGQQLDSRNFGRGSGIGSMMGGSLPGDNMPRSSAATSMPSGVSVNIQKNGDQPPRIQVKRGNDSWEIVGDDPGSLEQLPADVRPFVEQLLQGSSAINFARPGLPPRSGLHPGTRPHSPFSNDEMQQRLRRMEQQLQEMRQMMQEEMQSPPASQPADEQAH